MNIKLLLLAGAALAGTAAVPASAATIMNRAGLNTLLGATQLYEDFEKFTSSTQLASGEALSSATPNWAGQGPAKVIPGATYSSGVLYLNPNNYYGLRTHTLIGENNGSLTITYTTPVTAFGVDLGGFASYTSTGAISVFDRAGVLLSSTRVQGGFNGANTFFGYESAGGIGRVVITEDFNTYLNIDNHGYGVAIAAAVPEPANWALLIGGFGLVGAAARRRTRTSVVFA